MGSCVFGPVPSRRLGRSLGVDLVPFKTCTFDCIYCQLGPTPRPTLERRVFVPVATVLADVRAALASEPDVVTLSGSGEPTLHAEVGEVIAGLKAMTERPVVVLTNGSLLGDPAVRAALREADIVCPSLDAHDEASFRRVNRPHPGLDFARLLEGLRAFRREFAGKLWLEVMLLAGLTATEEAAGRLAESARSVELDRIQLNTATRPPADPAARPADRETLERLAPRFGPKAEVIAARGPSTETPAHAARCEDVLAMLRRRPCTINDVASGLSIHRNEAVKYVDALLSEGRLRAERTGGEVYYRAVPGAAGRHNSVDAGGALPIV